MTQVQGLQALKERKAALEKHLTTLTTNQAVYRDRMKTVEASVKELGFSSVEEAVEYVKVNGPKFEQALERIESYTDELLTRMKNGPPKEDSINL